MVESVRRPSPEHSSGETTLDATSRAWSLSSSPAAGALMTIPVAVVFFVFQRRIMNAAGGAVKE